MTTLEKVRPAAPCESIAQRGGCLDGTAQSGPRTVKSLHVDTQRGWRGGEQQVLALAAALERQGQPTLVAARDGQPLAQRARLAGLRVVPCAPWSEFAPLAAIGLRRAIIAHGIDIVHAHTGHAIALAALSVMGTRAKIVVSRHVEFPPKKNLPTRYKYSRASAVIAASEAAARGLLSTRIDPERISVIRGGIDVHQPVTPIGSDKLAQFGIERRGPLVVMASALSAEKDPLAFVHAIARAAQRVPTLEALLLGDGAERSKVEAAISQLGLQNTLRLAGFQPDARAFMAAADLVVLSSRTEGGLSIALLEAMALGKPVASTAAGGVAELVETETSGLLVPTGDSEALGNAIVRIATDARVAQRLAEGARARASQFSIDTTAERTLDVYRRVLSVSSRMATAC